ncbi:MAG: NADH-quinone oxidoreductase subunit C [Deltaproteobacteria bacterium]|nr:NADH-quinone oxidoreductase subunit C [Deltaproteobacteria bacterium]
MNTAAIQQLLHERFGSGVGPVESARLSDAVEVDPLSVDEIALFLRDQPDLAFDCLNNLSGTDRPARGKIQVTYELFSYVHRHAFVLKVDARRDRPQVKTVENVWPAANWLEREVYDLLGVVFLGHSDLRRLLLPDDWIGYPLRKDYVEAPEYHGISTVRESILALPERR